MRPNFIETTEALIFVIPKVSLIDLLLNYLDIDFIIVEKRLIIIKNVDCEFKRKKKNNFHHKYYYSNFIIIPYSYIIFKFKKIATHLIL